MKSNITRLIAVILLIATVMLSLSSCVEFDFYTNLFDYLENQNGNNGGDGGDGDGDNDGGLPMLPDLPSDGSTGEFYPGSGQGDTSGLDFSARMMLSSVSIVCKFADSVSAGSGVIYKVDKTTGDAYIITNYHVVYSAGYGRADSIKLYLYGMHLNGYAISAKLLGGSVTYDIAVLKVSGSEVIKNSYAIAATVASSEDVRVMDRVYAVGNSEGMGMSATEGIVSVESESLELTGADNSLISLRVMRVDAAVNHGNSGGGLYDSQGRLIGIVSAKDVSSDVDNMGYAIPSDLAVKLANNIIDHCNGSSKTRVTKALMGITITAYVSGLEITPEGDKVYEVNLVEVIEISGGSLAEGKVKVGDIVNSITVDGKETKVWQIHHVTDAMLDARVGSTVVLNVTRNGQPLKFTFTISESDFTTVN